MELAKKIWAEAVDIGRGTAKFCDSDWFVGGVGDLIR